MTDPKALAQEIKALRELALFATHRHRCRFWSGGSITSECDCGYSEALAAADAARSAHPQPNAQGEEESRTGAGIEPLSVDGKQRAASAGSGGTRARVAPEPGAYPSSTIGAASTPPPSAQPPAPEIERIEALSEREKWEACSVGLGFVPPLNAESHLRSVGGPTSAKVRDRILAFLAERKEKP